MTYDEFIKKQTSTKKVLFQIGRLKNIDDIVWVLSDDNIWDGIYSWESDTDIDYSYGTGANGLLPYGYGGTDTLPVHEREKAIDITSILGGAVQLLEASTYAELVINKDSFLWDRLTQKISIHTSSGVSPKYEYTTLAAGISKGYSNVAGYYDSEIFYDSRIISAPSIKTSRDNQYFGKISFEGGSIKLDNTDGEFDDFNSESYFGAEVKLLFGGDDLVGTEYKTFYTGTVTDYSLDKDSVTIKFKDNRILLSKIIPQNTFTIEEFPDLDESAVGSVIPLGYGIIKKGKAYGIGNGFFKFVDTTYGNILSINKVYVNNVQRNFSFPDTTEGTFYIVDYEDGDDVSVDFSGYYNDNLLLINPLDIIKDLLVNNTLINYNESYFNLVNWEEARLASTKFIGVLISEPKEIIDVIEEISASVFGSMSINPNGKIEFHYRDTEKETVKDIDFYEFTSDLEIESGYKDYLNSVTVNYSKSWAIDTYITSKNISLQESLFNIYRVDINKEYNTLLVYPEDIEIFESEILKAFGGIFPIYKFTTKTQNIDLEVGDNIFLNAKLRVSADNNWIKAEILSKEIDLNDFSVTFEVRYVVEDFLEISAQDGLNLDLVIDIEDGENIEYILEPEEIRR